jgi:hypothetical protein
MIAPLIFQPEAFRCRYLGRLARNEWPPPRVPRVAKEMQLRMTGSTVSALSETTFPAAGAVSKPR